jgi:hypothetical protein
LVVTTRTTKHLADSGTKRLGRARPTLYLALGGVFAALAIGACSLDQDQAAAPEAEAEPGLETEAVCQTCGGDTDPPTLPLCSSTCNYASDCAKACESNDGTQTTCGGVKVCRSCSNACTATASCSTTCKNGSSITTCGGYGTCQKYDVYCAYPVITAARISDNNESGTGGAVAYMYFGSATSPKTANFPSVIGGYNYTTISAWASNFRGPYPVNGESARTQWEWYDSAPGGLAVDFGDKGTPYIYGKECRAVSAGSPIPNLTTKTENIYEDDECFWGICNPDDYVGSFTMNRAFCNSEVFASGLTEKWSTGHSATVTGDVSLVNYKLWCSACLDATSPYCSKGLQ